MVDKTKDGWITTNALKAGKCERASDELIEITLYRSCLQWYQVKAVYKVNGRTEVSTYKRIQDARKVYAKACERADIGGF